MIRGYYATLGTRQRPLIDAVLHFPGINGVLDARLLVDTGADRTVLGTLDARRLQAELGLDLATLSEGVPSIGVGGQTPTRIIEAELTLDTFATLLMLAILEPRPGQPPIPSLLGRDILSRFALFLEERTKRVLLLVPEEADRLHLP